MLYDYGLSFFGNKKNFNTRIETKNIVLGGAKPKDLLTLAMVWSCKG
jgi:hypothetical protein